MKVFYMKILTGYHFVYTFHFPKIGYGWSIFEASAAIKNFEIFSGAVAGPEPESQKFNRVFIFRGF